jgi:hypothetical protein
MLNPSLLQKALDLLMIRITEKEMEKDEIES